MTNQRDGLFRAPAGSTVRGKLMRRSDITGGVLKTYYGPGQPANVGWPGQSYIAPSDWPARGRIIRPVQVAWLSQMLDVRYTDQVGFGVGTYSVSYTDPDARGPDDDLGGFNVTVPFDMPNPVGIHRARLNAAFAQAKAHIEAIRPGRTYVVVQDWGVNTRTSSYLFFTNWSNANLWVSTTFPHMRAPNPTATGWLGTDFFHLYAGNLVQDSPDPPIAGSHLRLGVGAGSGHNDTNYVAGPSASYLDGDYFANSLAAMQAAASRFSRQTVRVWDTASFGWGSATVHGPFGALADFAALEPGAWAAAVAYTSGLAGSLTSALVADYAGGSEQMRACCLDAASRGLDIQVAGSIADLDYNAIVAAVADHYRFDPNTGADLG